MAERVATASPWLRP